MAAGWTIFWIAVAVFFEDVPRTTTSAPIALRSTLHASSANEKKAGRSHESSFNVTETEVPTATPDAPTRAPSLVPYKMTWRQWGVSATMCWFAMTCFFILGAWESNIPVFTASSDPANPFHFSPFAAGNMIALGGACTIPFLLLNLHFARRVQDRHTLALGTSIGLSGLLIATAILRAEKVNYGSLFVSWFLVALGFNVASTVTLSLLSKQLPSHWNGRISLFIQWSNYTGRVTGAVWGGAGVQVGMLSYVGLQIALVGIGSVMFMTLWRQLKAKTG